jgi:methyl-accepting chemotaxis protein
VHINIFGTDAKAILAAVSSSQAIIEFGLDGKIITANENFCRALGYQLSEIQGRHHSMFCEPTYVASPEYKQFWADLGAGRFDSREYKRISKTGEEVWIQASYNPVFRGGKPYKVVKVATDITAQKLRSAEDAGKIAAISRAQAMIEFTPTGEILTANDNFLKTLGYSLSEIQGKHHAMFCEPSYTQSPDYQRFWQKLSSGEFFSEEFKRIGKGGKVVWIQASYNPILDMNGKVFKVVKFATDITDRVRSVDDVAAGLTALADGDLTARIDRPLIPSLDRLRLDFNN